MPKTTKDQFLPGPLPGEEDVEVCAHQRRRKKAKKSQIKSPKCTKPADESRTQTKQPTMRRICRAVATRFTLNLVFVRRSRFPRIESNRIDSYTGACHGCSPPEKSPRPERTDASRS